VFKNFVWMLSCTRFRPKFRWLRTINTSKSTEN